MIRLDTRRDTSHYPTARWPAGVVVTTDEAAAAAVTESNELVVWAVSIAYEDPEPVIDPGRMARVTWVRGRIVAPRKCRPDVRQFVPLHAVVRYASTRVVQRGL